MKEAHLSDLHVTINEILQLMQHHTLEDVTNVGATLIGFAIRHADWDNDKKWKTIQESTNRIFEFLCKNDEDFMRYMEDELLK